jgi:hypothetical protein
MDYQLFIEGFALFSAGPLIFDGFLWDFDVF